MRAPAVVSDVQRELLGEWKLESSYLEVKATGEKKSVYTGRRMDHSCPSMRTVCLSR